jgi:hypothetical protein
MVIVPRSLIKWPKAVTEAIHDRLDKGLVWMVIEHHFKTINIEWGVYFDKVFHHTKGGLNVRVINQMRWRRGERRS